MNYTAGLIITRDNSLSIGSLCHLYFHTPILNSQHHLHRSFTPWLSSLIVCWQWISQWGLVYMAWMIKPTIISFTHASLRWLYGKRMGQLLNILLNTTNGEWKQKYNSLNQLMCPNYISVFLLLHSFKILEMNFRCFKPPTPAPLRWIFNSHQPQCICISNLPSWVC